MRRVVMRHAVAVAQLKAFAVAQAKSIVEYGVPAGTGALPPAP